MRSLGGGGHPGAGSALVNFVNPDTIEEMITELIRGNQQASVQVSDLMSFPVFTVSSDMPMQNVAEILREKGCTGVPVVDDGKIVITSYSIHYTKLYEADRRNRMSLLSSVRCC